MKPSGKSLRILAIVKNSPASYARDDKNVGYFSYPVDEFTWDYISPGKGEVIDTHQWQRRGYDLIVHIDGGNWCEYRGASIPVVYYVIDSTLSDEFHFVPRFEQACRADLVLIDHDRLERFQSCGRPVRRWSYCVNDRLFHPAEKTLDVCYHCGGSPERAVMRTQLSDLCKAHGMSYRSGASPLPEYAADMNRAKVVVNVPRNPNNRPHRVFDAMASGAALASTPFPQIIGEHMEAGTNYFDLSVMDLNALPEIVDNYWHPVADMGRRTVMQYHTWAIRARQLRQMLCEELGL